MSNVPKPNMIVRSEAPFNAEPPLARLRSRFITARSDFYVRGHGDIPRIDETTYVLHVTGRVTAPQRLTMADIRTRFPARSVTAVLQCAGNRRGDLQAVGPTSGDPWAAGAIGNAVWTGAALSDVLRSAGVETSPALHVAFDASDEIQMPGENRFTYGVSIPIGKALSPEVLLAYAMNSQPLSPEHGFPLRAVVPGFAGVRSAKWLSAITVQDHPSSNHMQQRDYKLLPPDMRLDTLDWSKGVTINDMPLNSAICEPAANASLKPGPITIRGYAIASARPITRVDVSSDGGQTWTQAELEQDPNAPWAWTFWTATRQLTEGTHELIARAWDSAGQTQPARPRDVWNVKGYLSAAWHRIKVSAR